MGILAFFGFKKFDDGVYQLYSQIVAQARVVDFYTIQGVADTANGRFDLIALHAYIVMRRLKDIGEEGSQLSQDLFDIMFADMDKNIREMGVGDMGISRRIKKMIGAFYGRVKAYDEAMSEDNDSDLIAALQRNLDNGEQIEAAKLTRMANYMRQSWQAIDAMDISRLLAGEVDLAAIPGEET